jgi:hypothetical protein
MREYTGNTWIYHPLFNLRMLTGTLQCDTGEVENGFYAPFDGILFMCQT